MDAKPTLRLRVGFVFVDLFMFVLAWHRRFRDDDSALGRFAAALLGGLVVGIGALQRTRRAWRAFVWAVRGLNPWWHCQLCQKRGVRGSAAFCRKCCLMGLGFADDESDGADLEVGS